MDFRSSDSGFSGLLVRPARLPDEGVLSHHMRAARSNGVPASTLLRAFAVPGRHGVCRFCPQCLAEDGIYREEWMQPETVACLKHECWLVERCACGKPVTWKRGTVFFCDCAKDLRELEPIALAPSIREGMQWWVGSLGQQGPMPKIHASLRRRLTLLVGAYAMTDGANLPLHKAHGMSVEAQRPLIKAGLNILQRFDTRYEPFLDDLYWRSRCARSTSRESRLFKSFGSQLLSICPADKNNALTVEYALVRMRYEAKLLSSKHKRYAKKAKENSPWVSVKTAAKTLGVPPSIVHRLIDLNKLVAVVQTSRKRRRLTLIRCSELDSFQRKHGALLRADKVRNRLELNKVQFREFLATGQVRPIIRVQDERKTRYFATAALEQWFATLPKKKGKPDEGALVSLSWTLRYVHFYGENRFQQLFDAIRAKKLKLFASATLSSLKEIRFNKAELLSWASTQLDNAPCNDVRLGRALSVKPEVIRHLRQAGVWNCNAQETDEALTLREAVSSFESKYITGQTLATKYNLTARHLFNTLRDEGVMPAFGPQVDACRQNIYQLSDLDEYHHEILGSLKSKSAVTGK